MSNLQELRCLLVRKYIVAQRIKKGKLFSKDSICSVCHVKKKKKIKQHPGSMQFCMNSEFPASEGTQEVVTIYISLFIISY